MLLKLAKPSSLVAAPTVIALGALQGDMVQLSPPLLLPAQQLARHNKQQVFSNGMAGQTIVSPAQVCLVPQPQQVGRLAMQASAMMAGRLSVAF